MNDHGRPRAALAAHAAAVAVLLLAACSGPPGPTSAASARPTQSATGAGHGPQPGAPSVGQEEVVGETANGDVVLIDPDRGGRLATVIANVASGEEVSAAADGSTIYYEQQGGCTNQIYSIPATGGPPTLVIAGSVPAVSPDGSKLAYVRQPRGSAQCAHQVPPSQVALVVRNLKSGSETAFPAAPQLVQSGLFYPIDHLSWSADGRRLLVSEEAPEDNTGWSLVVVDPRTAKYYRTGEPGESIPVTGDPQGRSYYREGVYMPDGNLFVNRVCCVGMGPGPRRTSTLLDEVSTSGVVIRQVAVGFTDRDHTSLAVDPAGQELLYLSGGDLYISDGGQRPRLVAGGLMSATWITRR